MEEIDNIIQRRVEELKKLHYDTYVQCKVSVGNNKFWMSKMHAINYKNYNRNINVYGYLKKLIKDPDKLHELVREENMVRTQINIEKHRQKILFILDTIHKKKLNRRLIKAIKNHFIESNIRKWFSDTTIINEIIEIYNSVKNLEKNKNLEK